MLLLHTQSIQLCVLVVQSQEYAAVAAGIMAIEAGHAAVIRNQLYQVNHFCGYS